MALGDVIARLAVSLTLETAAFEQGATAAEKRLAQSQKKIEALGKSMTSVGTKLSVGFTLPVVAAGKAAVEGLIEQERAMADVSAALASMGGASGRTAEQLSKAADAMEMHSLFDAEVILKQVTAQLLTFGNVSGQVFDRAQQAAIDMAARLGSDPQSAAIMLGKALNNPLKGLTALQKVGVAFDAQQKKQIESMVEAGNLAGAQAIILNELEKEYRGAAAAAADASPWRAAQVAIGQAADAIGAQLIPLIQPVSEAIAGIAKGFAALPEPLQKFAVVAAAAGAAFGPLLVGIGSVVSAGSTLFAAVGSIAGSMAATGTAAGAAEVGIAAMGGALTALGPLVAIVAGIAAAGYLIYENWDKIAPALNEFWTAAKDALGPPLQELIATLTGALSELWNGPIGQGIRTAVGLWGEWQVMVLKALGPALIGVIKIAIQTIGNIAHVIADVVHAVSALLQGDFTGAFQAAFSAVNRTFGGLPAYVIGLMQRLVTGVRTWVIDRLDAIWKQVTDKVDRVRKAFFWLYDAVVGHSYIPDMVDEIGANMARLQELMVDPAERAANKIEDRFKSLADRMVKLTAKLFPEVQAREQFRSDMATIDDAEASGLWSSQIADEHRKRLIEDSSAGTGINDIAYNYPLLTQAANDNAEQIGAANQRLGQSFEDMSQRALSSLRGLIDGIKSGDILDILGSALSLVGSLLGGGTGGTLSNIGSILSSGAGGGLPGFATGTPSAPRGLALVGERGPELVKFRGGERVFNNADSKAMMGGRSAMAPIHFDLRGAVVTQDLLDQMNAISNGNANTAIVRERQRDTRKQSRKLGGGKR